MAKAVYKVAPRTAIKRVLSSHTNSAKKGVGSLKRAAALTRCPGGMCISSNSARCTHRFAFPHDHSDDEWPGALSAHVRNHVKVNGAANCSASRSTARALRGLRWYRQLSDKWAFIFMMSVRLNCNFAGKWCASRARN